MRYFLLIIIFITQTLYTMDSEVHEILKEAAHIFEQAQSNETPKQTPQSPKASVDQQEVSAIHKQAQELFNTADGKTIQDFKDKEEQRLKEIQQVRAFLDKSLPCQWGHKPACHVNCPPMSCSFNCGKILRRCMRSEGCDRKELDEQLYDALIGPADTWKERRCKAAGLVCAGADPNLKIETLTPLVIGMLYNDVSFVKLVLEKGADPNKKTGAHIGCTYPRCVRYDGNSVEGIIKYKANYTSSPPLYWSFLSRRNPIFTPLLLEYGAEVKDIVDNVHNGTSSFTRALEALARQCDDPHYTSELILAKAKLLIEAGAGPSDDDIKAARRATRQYRDKESSYKPCKSLGEFLAKIHINQKN